MNTLSENKEVATLGGGCFWCLEAVFQEVDGITRVVSGYAGGHVTSPSYAQICTGSTGHAEVIQIAFDPQIVSYREILEIFFSIHDPTTLNRQGADVGTQYRSIILYHTQEQRDIAEDVIAAFNREKIWLDPIVTEIERLDTFYPAEEYHQQYYERNSWQPYCRVVITPKVNKFRKQFKTQLKV